MREGSAGSAAEGRQRAPRGCSVCATCAGDAPLQLLPPAHLPGEGHLQDLQGGPGRGGEEGRSECVGQSAACGAGSSRRRSPAQQAAHLPRRLVLQLLHAVRVAPLSLRRSGRCRRRRQQDAGSTGQAGVHVPAASCTACTCSSSLRDRSRSNSTTMAAGDTRWMSATVSCTACWDTWAVPNR